MAEIVDFGLQQHKIKMDSRYFENVLSVVAGDTGRRLEVQLLDTNGMVQDTTGLSLRLNAEIAGKSTFTDATLVDAATGIYQLDLSNGMFLAPGNWQFQWLITDTAGKKLHSFTFTGKVGKNISEGGSQATNFYLNLEDLKAMQDDLVNGTFDSEALETNISEKLTNLETEYAPKLTEVTAQLAQTGAVKVGGGIKAQLEDLSETVLSAIEGGDGTNFNLLSIPQNNSVNPMKIDVTRYNLLDVNTTVKNFYMSGTTLETYNLKASTTVDVSNPIDCIAGERYKISLGDPTTPVYFFDSNDNYHSAYYKTGFLDSPVSFTIPDGVSIFRVNMRTSKVPLENYVIAKEENFEKVKEVTIPWLKITNDNLHADFEFPTNTIVPTQPIFSNWYNHKNGKKIVTFGNSRTWYDSKTYGTGTKEAGQTVRGYQTYIREQLGMETINVGVSGSRIHQTVDLIKNYAFTGDEYAISLMHGTNNFNAVAGGESGYSLGTVDHTKSGSYDVMSYAGGLQEFVEWVSINKPGLKMYLMTDAWCYKGGYGGMDREYSDIMREVAELYHYPFLDLYHMCGFNENNMNEYFVDSGSNLFHENTKGYERTSEIIVPFIANH